MTNRTEEVLQIYGSAIEKNLFEEALINYDLAIQKNPENSNNFNCKAKTLDEMNRFEEAFKNYDQPIQKNPGYSYYYYKKGRVKYIINLKLLLCREDEQIRIGITKLRFRDFEKSRKFTIFSWQRLREALNYYDLAIQKNPENPNSYNGKANILAKMNRLEEALNNYDLAIQKDPENSSHFNGKAITLHKMNRFKEALINHNAAIIIIQHPPPNNQARQDCQELPLEILLSSFNC
ncbi:unnamed protein product [Paramecium octaurelia]|uniref:Tetratricopeptide repeat protein n=1 Tax=Paramecium octaurelia TaxID=43137 RepID=A0A8S1UCU5_PAROT|nr:unnamed protein product [Paramecium octaurelia]